MSQERACTHPGTTTTSPHEIPHWAINAVKVLMGALSVLTIVAGVWWSLRNDVSLVTERVSRVELRVGYVEESMDKLATKAEIDAKIDAILREIQGLRNDMNRQWDTVTGASPYHQGGQRRDRK